MGKRWRATGAVNCYARLTPMSDDPKKTSYVLAALAVGFTGLAVAFAVNGGGSPRPVASRSPGAVAPRTGTVRISAGQLIRSGGDTSGLECYTCHDEKKAVELKFDDQHRLVFPKE